MLNVQSPSNNIAKQSDNIYDMIKIKVHLNEHFYIFSRYLISRMLTLCRVRKLDAIQIAKEIKKQLIEQSKLEIHQNELEAIIFETMRKFGYENSIQKYSLVAHFYGKRTPMIILIFGAPCIGKSLIANCLAERLNVSNVLQTDIVEIVMRDLDGNYFQTLKNMDEIEDEKQLIDNFKQTCRVIRKGVSTDISKCLIEGKPVIIEGITLSPDLFLQQLNENQVNAEEEEKKTTELIQMYIKNEIKMKKQQRRDPYFFNSPEKVKKRWKIIYPNPEISEQIDEIKREWKLVKEQEKIDQSSALILGFLLVLNKKDHVYNIENNIPKNQQENKILIDRKVKNYQRIQQYLLKQNEKTYAIPVNLHNLDDTLDLMHDIILEKIAQQ